jgi:hypothetical protein
MQYGGWFNWVASMNFRKLNRGFEATGRVQLLYNIEMLLPLWTIR